MQRQKELERIKKQELIDEFESENKLIAIENQNQGLVVLFLRDLTSSFDILFNRYQLKKCKNSIESSEQIQILHEKFLDLKEDETIQNYLKRIQIIMDFLQICIKNNPDGCEFYLVALNSMFTQLLKYAAEIIGRKYDALELMLDEHVKLQQKRSDNIQMLYKNKGDFLEKLVDYFLEMSEKLNQTSKQIKENLGKENTIKKIIGRRVFY